MSNHSSTGEPSVNGSWQEPGLVKQAERIVRSHLHFTGRRLLDADVNGIDLARALFETPMVVVSHGTEADPVLNYGNATALALWSMTWEQFTRTPSRFTAEAPNRDERARLLAAVTARGHIDDYSGVRITQDGRRFRIARATVWNLITETGEPCGQAATFRQWEWL
jgi:MEKHLA domain